MKDTCTIIDLTPIWDDLKAFYAAESFKEYREAPTRLSHPIARISCKNVMCSYMETGMETNFN